MSSHYTPGPWRWSILPPEVHAENGQLTLARVSGVGLARGGQETVEANARLMAGAPELLAALLALTDAAERVKHFNLTRDETVRALAPPLVAAREAIARAAGEGNS